MNAPLRLVADDREADVPHTDVAHTDVAHTDVTQANVAQAATIPLRELFPLLSYAHRHDLKWLRDFGDDRVTLSADLAEVIHEFARLVERRRSA